MEQISAYIELQKLFLYNTEDLQIEEIAKFIIDNNLFSDQMKSLFTMQIIASIVYSYPNILDPTIQILKLIEKINIDPYFLFSKYANEKTINRMLIIYLLLCLSNHITLSEIDVPLSPKGLAFINPIYASHFPQYPGFNKYDDFQHILKLQDDDKIKIRNKLYSTNIIVQTMINDDIDQLIKLLSQNNIDLNEKMHESIFEMHEILKKATPIEYAAFLGAEKCFKFLLLKTDNVDFDDLIKYAIAGGNCEIIHIIENHLENPPEQEILNSAILYMRNDLIEYILNNYDVTITIVNYINCIYAFNYEALSILIEFDKNNEKTGNEQKIVFNSFVDLNIYFNFKSSVPSIFGCQSNFSLKQKTIKSALNGKKFDVLNFIFTDETIKKNSAVFAPVSFVLQYKEEQAIKEIQTLRYEYSDEFWWYIDDPDKYFYEDWYYDDWDYDFVDEREFVGIDNINKKQKNRLMKKKLNREPSKNKYEKKEAKHLIKSKKKNMLKNFKFEMKEYFAYNVLIDD